MNSDQSGHGGHLDDGTIQELLDAAEGRNARAARTPRGAHARAAARHLADCADCQARARAWREAFGELRQLRRFTPPGRFAERVMARVDLPGEVAGRSKARWWARLRRRGTPPASNAHLSGRRLQELADGTPSRRRASAARTHLAACADCEGRLTRWRRLIAVLEALPSLAPTAGFSERVMARWREVSDEATEASREGWGRLGPASPRGWVLAGTLFGSPIAAVAMAATFISTLPQLTAVGLVGYLWWQARDALAGAARSLLAAVMQSGTTFRAYALADYLIASPAIAVAGAAAFSALMATSLWILYRNLGFPRLPLRHVHG